MEWWSIGLLVVQMLLVSISGSAPFSGRNACVTRSCGYPKFVFCLGVMKRQNSRTWTETMMNPRESSSISNPKLQYSNTPPLHYSTSPFLPSLHLSFTRPNNPPSMFNVTCKPRSRSPSILPAGYEILPCQVSSLSCAHYTKFPLYSDLCGVAY